jgi:hypothetical protein
VTGSCQPFLPDCQTSYAAEYDKAQAAGVNATALFVHWASFERDGSGSGCDPMFESFWWNNDGFGLEALAARGLTVSLTLPALDGSRPSLPCDLMPASPPATGPWHIAWDSPTLVSRYDAMFDQLAPLLGDNVAYFSVGNEVNYYLEKCDSAERAAFASFVTQVTSHIHDVKPKLKVGVTVTARTLMGGPLADYVSSELNAQTDVLYLTYYDVDGEKALPPAQVEDDMNTLVAAAGGKPLVFQELGYPSSSYPGIDSSPELQAEFVHHAFAAWRASGSAAVPFVSVFKQRDWTLDFCHTYAGMKPPEVMAQYLCSLGLTDADDNPKTAWSALLDEATETGL